ncbi:hypothetical protein CMI48_00585 [Candidatus Pacearchaeota archaeon]|nr:hypothetical protein [Candidatus Pacearchaeota archaeon]
MTLTELFQLQDPIVLTIATGIIAFAVITTLLKPAFKKNKGTAVAIGIILAILTSYNLHQNRFYGWEQSMAIIIFLAVAALFLKITWAFAKHTSTSAGRR